ncbi:MAG: hypothetical protein WCP79_08815 [Bacillota bacterium]
MSGKSNLFLIIALLVICTTSFTQAAVITGKGVPAIPQNDPQHSPFAFITEYISRYPGFGNEYPRFYFNEGYLNFQEDYWLAGGVSVAKWKYNIPSTKNTTNDFNNNSKSPDIAWQLLNAIDQIPGAGKNTYVVSYSSDSVDTTGGKLDLFSQFPKIPKTNIHISSSDYVTHGKNMLATNGSVWFSQNGSVNLQTVELTTKANNSLVFVETTPTLYNHFLGLWHAVRDNGTSGEYFTDGTKDSTGLTASQPVQIGARRVAFYAGRNNGFVGPTWDNGGLDTPFPDNLYPPIRNEITNLDNVNWYDQVLYDAGELLYDNANSVTIDIAMFEIGLENPFIDNLYRFVNKGFENGKAISKTHPAHTPQGGTNFPGKLTVNLYYQFQDPPGFTTPTATHNYLNTNDGNVTNGNYGINVVKVWQGFAEQGLTEPTTPMDMHHKFALITYQNSSGAISDYKLYVASSNLDQPCVGSGKKWQSGTVIQASTASDPLFAFYKTQIQYLTLGQAYASTQNGNNGNSYFDSNIDTKFVNMLTASGIAAFVYPLQVPD